MTRFVLVPQWQGSSSARAMSLVAGVDAIAGDLPQAATTRVEVPLEAGEAIDTGVDRASALLRIRREVSAVLAEITDERIVLIGGDCGVAPIIIDHTIAHHAGADDLAVVWFDAHGDFNTPETSPSRAYGGMALSSVVGDGAKQFVLGTPVSPARVVLAGVRSIDDDEWSRIEERGVTLLSPSDLTPASLAASVAATNTRRVHIHVDLDVLDPAHVRGVSSAEPFGVDPKVLVDAIRAVAEHTDVASASIGGFAPHSSDDIVNDMGTILRVIGALAR